MFVCLFVCLLCLEIWMYRRLLIGVIATFCVSTPSSTSSCLFRVPTRRPRRSRLHLFSFQVGWKLASYCLELVESTWTNDGRFAFLIELDFQSPLSRYLNWIKNELNSIETPLLDIYMNYFWKKWGRVAEWSALRTSTQVARVRSQPTSKLFSE